MLIMHGFYAFFLKMWGRKIRFRCILWWTGLGYVAFQSLNVLKYWKDNATRFKELSRMTYNVICISITTMSSEASFNLGIYVLSKYRSRLFPSNIQSLICVGNWLCGYEVMSKFNDFYTDMFAVCFLFVQETRFGIMICLMVCCVAHPFDISTYV